MKTLEEMLVESIDCVPENVADVMYDYVADGELDVVYDAMEFCTNKALDRVLELYHYHDGSVLMSEIIDQVKNELK